MNSPEAVKPVITYDTSPAQYKHWSLACDGAIATLTLNINEDGGIKPGYKLKLNSYDLGVDMELHDALQRVRFEHPEVKTVVVTSGKDRIFCSGAHLARRELAVVFRQILTRLPDIEVTGSPDFLDSLGPPLVGGVKRLPVRFTPTARIGAG